MAAVAAIPSHPHPLTFRPADHASADLINDPRDFMPGNARVLDTGPVAFLREFVTVADSTCLHANADCAGARLWYVTFNQFDRPPGRVTCATFIIFAIRILLKRNLDTCLSSCLIRTGAFNANYP